MITQGVNMDNLNISELLNKTLVSIEKTFNDEKRITSLLFTTDSNEKYEMYHSQDCCETVYLENIDGDLKDLIGKPIRMAEEITNENDTKRLRNTPLEEHAESFTWTFYKFATINGYVTLRWFGESNGYYSEKVDFIKL